MKNIFIDDLSVNNQKYKKTFWKSIFLIIFLLIITTVATLPTNNLLPQLISLLLIGLFFLISRKMKIYFLTDFYFSKRDLFYILIGYVSTYAIDIIHNRVFNSISDNQISIQNELQDKSIFLTFILIVIIVPILEEILFRGIILRLIFRNHLFIGIIVSSVLFALYHPSSNIIDYTPYFLSGLIFGFVYLKTKKFQNAIAIHCLNNLIGTIPLFFT